MNPLHALAATFDDRCGPDDDPDHPGCEQPADPTDDDSPSPGDFDLDVAIDLRAIQRDPHARGRTIAVRPWDHLVGLCDHQTACMLDEDHPGLVHLPAHVIIFRSGRIGLLHWLTDYVYAAHALNGGCISNEVVARAAGLEGRADTFWRSGEEVRTHESYDDLVAEATDEQLTALARVHRYECAVVDHFGGRIRGIWAHRQGHRSRTSDPGSRIYAVAEDSRIELGLADVRELHFGTGTEIPAAWRVRP